MGRAPRGAWPPRWTPQASWGGALPASASATGAPEGSRASPAPPSRQPRCACIVQLQERSCTKGVSRLLGPSTPASCAVSICFQWLASLALWGNAPASDQVLAELTLPSGCLQAYPPPVQPDASNPVFSNMTAEQWEFFLELLLEQVAAALLVLVACCCWTPASLPPAAPAQAPKGAVAEPCKPCCH